MRATLVATLVAALWRAWQPSGTSARTRSVKGSELTRELPGLAITPGLSGIDVVVDANPTGETRDLLVALRRSGTSVRWSGTPPPLAIAVTPLRDPSGGSRVVVAGGATAALALTDSAGPLDSLRAEQGATLELSAPVGVIRVAQGGFSASSAVGRSSTRRGVLVLGRLGWESKFVMQALGEAGWAVRVRVPAAPGAIVLDQDILPIDTGRYDVVVALDSTAADFAPAIARFVMQGGGLVASGGALRLEALRPLVPGRASERQPGRILLGADTVTPPDLPARAISGLRDDALVLEQTRAGVMLAARRAGLGRAIAVGYDESWRWRMLGGTSGAAAHRAWWSRTVSSVAPERPFAEGKPTGDEAPLAALVGALGPPSIVSAMESRPTRDRLPLALFALIAVALLAETASRRFRGAR